MIKKLILSNLDNEPLGHNVLYHQWENAKDIWNNTNPTNKSDAIGIERILKLILILSQFLFLGIYFRAFFGQYGKLYKHIGVEFHVILKLILSIIILYLEPYKSELSPTLEFLLKFWLYWMIFETISYTANLVFSEDVFAKPHSHKRNLILIIIDYITLNLDFANLYLIEKSIKHVITNGLIVNDGFNAVYFSFITSLTIGYGDIVPTEEGRYLIVFQAIVMLLFGVLFLNFYLSRASNKN